jgi:hypothetical protein
MRRGRRGRFGRARIDRTIFGGIDIRGIAS